MVGLDNRRCPEWRGPEQWGQLRWEAALKEKIVRGREDTKTNVIEKKKKWCYTLVLKGE